MLLDCYESARSNFDGFFKAKGGPFVFLILLTRSEKGRRHEPHFPGAISGGKRYRLRRPLGVRLAPDDATFMEGR